MGEFTEDQQKQIDAETNEQDKEALRVLFREQAAEDQRIKRSIVEIDAANEANEASMNLVLSHDHKWKRGMLPGGKYIKTCACGKMEEIDFAEFSVLTN